MGRAGFGVRLVAGVVDAVAMLLVYWIIYLIIEPSIDGTTNFSTYVARVRWAVIVGTVLMIGYSLCDVFLRATPGKLLFKLRVTGAMGEPPTQGQLWMRWAFRWGFLALNLFCGIVYGTMIGIYLRVLCLMVLAAVFAYFTMLLTSYGWAVYDRWARTSVTLLGYLKLPPGLGRLIYWTPGQAGGAPVTAAPAGMTPPPPGPYIETPTAPTPPPAPPVAAGSGAPMGDVPTRVSARRPDEGPIPLDEPAPPPAPPANPA
jgi:hypothetical protein